MSRGDGMSEIANTFSESARTPSAEKMCPTNFASLSLISTHAFRLSLAKFFAWDMRRVVKRIEKEEKISFALFAFEVQIFQLLQNFLTAKPIRLSS